MPKKNSRSTKKTKGTRMETRFSYKNRKTIGKTRREKNEPLTLRIEEDVFDDPSINLKHTCCRILEQILFPNRHSIKGIDVIRNYLIKVGDSNKYLSGKNIVPSLLEIKQDLNKAFTQLKIPHGRLIGTPALSKEELKYLYLTPEAAKFEQIKKDDWLNRLVENTLSETDPAEQKIEMNKNIFKWLTEIETDDKDPPLTPIPSELDLKPEDKWMDLSQIYSDAYDSLKSKEKVGGVTELTKTLPSSIPTTYIQINVGKVETFKSQLNEVLKGPIKDAQEFAKKLSEFLLSFIKIGIIFFGTFIKISAIFVANLITNLIKEKTNNRFRELFLKVINGVIGVPFVISDDNSDIQSEITNKYKLFLIAIVMKTLFMLGTIDKARDFDPTPTNIREILNTGLKRLHLYNIGKLMPAMGEHRAYADKIMSYMNKYTEWYLERKTTIFLNIKSLDTENPRVLLLEDRPEPRLMDVSQIASAEGFGPFGSQPLVPGHDLDDDENVQPPKRRRVSPTATKLGSEGDEADEGQEEEWRQRHAQLDASQNKSKKRRKNKSNTKKRKRKSSKGKHKRKSKIKKRKKIKKKTKQKK